MLSCSRRQREGFSLASNEHDPGYGAASSPAGRIDLPGNTGSWGGARHRDRAHAAFSIILRRAWAVWSIWSCMGP